MSLRGKIAVVTGGANGIGAAMASRLRADGATVAIVDVQEPKAELLADQAGQGAGVFFACDVVDGAAVVDCAAQILGRLGPVAILVNNAGGSGKTPARTIEEHSDDIWHYVMDLNVTSIIRFCRALVPGMRQAGFGRIINISSGSRHGMAGPFPTMKSHLAYATAKGAQVILTRQLATDLGPSGITCNAIAPGMILPDPEARITRIIMEQPEEFRAGMLARIPSRRFGNGQDIAAVAAFLASEESAYVNGQTIDVTG